MSGRRSNRVGTGRCSTWQAVGGGRSIQLIGYEWLVRVVQQGRLGGRMKSLAGKVVG